ncbi:MAG: Tad domain-containing protein [Burkholderiaceae bacterium]
MFHQRGAVAVILGITVTVLIGFAGLAIDLGRFFIVKTELQNAMDACALSASTQLRPGQNNPNALTRAIAYGRVFTTGGVSENPWKAISRRSRTGCCSRRRWSMSRRTTSPSLRTWTVPMCPGLG